MSRKGGGGGAAAGPWSPEEVARFFEAFHKQDGAPDFAEIAAAVGGGRTPEGCEALHRKQAAYLSIPKELQSAQAFAAIVESTQKAAAVAAEQQPSSRSGEHGEEAAGSGPGGAAASRLKGEDGEDGMEEDAEGGAGGSEEEEGEEEEEEEEPSLAANRSRRTPKRGPLGRRTPLSGAKRGRGGALDIYELYDEAVTESARKRRSARQQLDFPAGQRRRHDTDEAKGLAGLLALAVAGEEESLGGMGSEEEEEEEDGYTARATRKKPRPRSTPQRRARAAAASSDEEEPEDAGAMDDDKSDEDFAPPAARRTPYSTPAKAGRLGGRPGSAHATPRRSGGRGGPGGGGAAAAGASPVALGLRGLSPYMLGSLEGGGDMLSDLVLTDLGYITSPGFPQFAQNFVPSPQNPLPRRRMRKSPPGRVAPAVASPIRTLFTRRSSLAASLMPSFGYTSAAGGAGAAAGEEGAGGGAGAAGAAPQSAAEVRLRHCLQQPRTQRWAAAEFCYSALDRPFFMFNPLAGLLSAMGLSEDARLTRQEWSIIRSGLGKPRRLSLKFLKEERARLERWRDGCRQQYQSGAAAADPKVAEHLPRPLSVGQRVVARHPTSRQLHDGSVLTVAHNCYRVQFDRQELGVELVRDTDVMPCDPSENLPPALLTSRPAMVLNGRAVINGQPVQPLALRLPPAPGAAGGAAAGGLPAALAAAAAAATPLAPAGAGGAGLLAPGSQQGPGSAGAANSTGTAGQQQQQAQQQARPADAKALAELVVGLDKKEALLLQLRAMNDEAAAGMHVADASGAAAPAFANAYAGVVLQLKDVNDKVKEKLVELDGNGSPRDASAAAAAGGAAGGGLQHQQLGASLAADAVLQRQLQAQTPEALSAAALGEAQRILAVCRQKLAGAPAAAAASKGLEGEISPAEGSTPGEADTAAATTAGSPDAASGEKAQGAASVEPSSQPSPASAAGTPSGASNGARGSQFWGSPEGQHLAGLIQGCVQSLVLLQQGAAQGGSLPAGALSGALDAALSAVAPREGVHKALYEEVKAAVASLKLQIGAAAS